MVAPISYVESESTICGIDIDLNVAPDIDEVGDDGYDSNDPCDHEVDSDSNLDVDEVPDDIDDEDVNDDGNINAPSVGTRFDRDQLCNVETRNLLISSVFLATFYRLTILMPRMGQQQVNQMEAGHVFVKDVRDAVVANRRMARSMNVEVYLQCFEMFRVTKTISRQPGIPPRSYGVDLRNRQCNCRRFQTLHYPCVHVVAACAKVLLNVEQFVDDLYTLECTLRVWENEFPVLPDLST
ncbi:hypothetical protein GOBAR_DD02716 [Gossypium barbadense]|nr:hypothetical protein GOBAR_DD02716 [Gossypium barbadense]